MRGHAAQKPSALTPPRRQDPLTGGGASHRLVAALRDWAAAVLPGHAASGILPLLTHANMLTVGRAAALLAVGRSALLCTPLLSSAFACRFALPHEPSQ